MTAPSSFPAGLNPGKNVDIRVLEAISRIGGVRIILYFEEELARSSTYHADLEQYASVPDDDRPFIEIGSFLAYQRKMSPCFDDALTTVPLQITILSSHEQEGGFPVVKGVLPFLDEMDLS